MRACAMKDLSLSAGEWRIWCKTPWVTWPFQHICSSAIRNKRVLLRVGKQLPIHSLKMKSKRCSHNLQSNHGGISQRIHVLRTSRVYNPTCKQNKKHGGRCQWEMQWLLYSLFNDFFFYFEALQFGKFTSSWTSFLTQQFLRDKGKATFC